ncbi:MAG: hypothetical protein ACKOBO_02465 [Acidimicrobiales bacterium]
MSRIVHLVRRAVGSLSDRGPDEDGYAAAARILNDRELDLWRAMAGRDRRHSLVVLGRFDRFCPAASRAERAAALLHDVGKSVSSLGWTMRVFATIFGAFGVVPGRRFREYLDHERIGAQMLEGVSDVRTVALVAGEATDAIATALQRADDL